MSGLIDNLGNFQARFKKKLNELRETVKNNDDCNIENTILELLRHLYSISSRTQNLPNLLETFWPEEIDCILSDCLKTWLKYVREGEVIPFVNFVLRTGYKDEPDLDDSGSPFAHRTTPLHRAARIYRSKLKASVRELFKIYDRFDVNYTNGMGCTHLHVACMYDCRDAVEQFIEHGADPNCIWLLTGDSPLHVAAKYASVALVESLLRRGADLTLCNKNESTALHIIAQRDFFARVFEVFDELNLLAQIDAQDKLGKTPLHLALQNVWFRENSGEALLRRGADPNLADKDGLTPLHVISNNCYDDVLVKMLFDVSEEQRQSVQIEARDNEGNTPLHTALYRNHMEVAKFLLRRGADPTVTNLKGLTPLHVICKTDDDNGSVNEFLEVCNEVRKTVRIDALDNLGRTPLQWALAGLLPNAVEALLNRGADLSSFDFPTESQYNECFRVSNESQGKLIVTYRAMVVVELLWINDIELDQGYALMIAKLFARFGLFKESPGLERSLRNNEVFVKLSKKILLKENPELYLYDLLQLRPEEAAKQLTHRDGLKFAASNKQWRTLPITHHETCAVHLGEIMSKRFFRKEALEPFMILIHCRLPILCCQMIIDELMNKDLYHIICLIASDRNDTPKRNESNDASENNESNDASEKNESNDASGNNESNDASESNESNDTSESNESNDSLESNESNDASGSNESNDSSESNEANDSS